MANKKVFTNESLATFVNETKAYVNTKIDESKAYIDEQIDDNIGGTLEITYGGNPEHSKTVLTLDPGAEEFSVYTAEEIDAKFEEFKPDNADWNETDTNSHAYIKNKPFGSVLGNDILEYVNRAGLEQSVSNTHGSFDYILHAIDNSPALEEGKTYQVNYEGVNYVCVAKTYTSGSNATCYLGNLNYMLKINDEFDESVQDTGEPFIILYIIQDNAMMIVLYDKTNSSFNLGIKAVEINKIDPKYVDTYTKTEINELTEQALSNYYTKSEVDKKLDNFSGGSYAEQVQSDWNETNTESPAYIKNKPAISANGTIVAQSDWTVNDSSDAAYIKNRPFYETTEIVEVLPLQDINIQIIDGQFQEQMILGELDNFDKEGVTYIVTYNGVEYTCVSSSYVGMIVVGNSAALGGENTGEPFVFAYDAIGSMTGQGPALLIMVLETPNDGEESITRSIKIDGKIAVINHIEPKYIKDMYHTTIEPIPIFETAGFDFTLDPQYSDYGIYSCYPTITSQIEYVSLIEGNSYNVIWDGVAYTCTAVALSLGDMSGFAIGNAALFGLGENTGEPFLIAAIPDYNSNAFMTMDTSSYHAIGISTDGESVSQIDPKYLPILESTGSITLVPEQYTVVADSSNNLYYYLLSSSTDYNTFLGLVDQIVYVTYNGKDYELPIITQNDEVGISNGDFNTSEESFIIKKSQDGVLMLINTTGSPVTVKVSTKPTDYSIKSKYLSGVTISGGSALPKVRWCMGYC